MIINKWYFQKFKEDIQNQNFLKTLPFVTFSDLQNPRYDLLAGVLEKVDFDKDTLISIGQKEAPYGLTLLPPDPKDYNLLLNSCRISFVLTDTMDENDYLIKSVMAGIMPICDKNHISIKRLGLTRYSVEPNLNSIVDKLNEILDNKHIFKYHIWKLSQKYRRQYLKWNKDKK